MLGKTKRNNMLAGLDWSVIAIYVALVLIGWISVYTSVYDSDHSSILEMSQRYGMHLIWICAGFVMAFIILLLDAKIYPVFAILIYIFTMLLLVAVLVIGVEVNGSKSWLAFGPVRFQPAELAKVATSLLLARVMSENGFKLSKLSDIFKIVMVFAIPIGLIFMQKDTGSAMVFASFVIVLYREGMNGMLVLSAIFLAILFIASLILDPTEIIIAVSIISILIFAFQNHRFIEPLKKTLILAAIIWALMSINKYFELNFETTYILLACTSAAALLTLIAYRHKLSKAIVAVVFFFICIAASFSVDYVFDNYLKPHQKDRIEDLLGIKVDLQGAGYNVYQSKIAIGSGGFSGKGFLQGTQTKFNFVPEQSTDFIFCTIGEEWGFLGCFLVVALYFTLLCKIVLIAERQKYAYVRIYAYCVAGILFFHFAANISMTIGLFPVIGIPLPFLSYGGSSLWAFTILLFILLKLDTTRKRQD